METREQYDAIRLELKNLSLELKDLNKSCNDRLTKIESAYNFNNLSNLNKDFMQKEKANI